MVPFVINGEIWRAVRVKPDSPYLVDKTGTMRVATTNPVLREISLSNRLEPPILDRVVLHEVIHAIDASNGISWRLAHKKDASVVDLEELIAQTVENYGILALEISSKILGRPICVQGLCYDKH